MKRTIILSVAAILCLCISTFINVEESNLWTKCVFYGSFVLAVVLIIVQGADSFSASEELTRAKLTLKEIKEYGKVALWNYKGSRSISDGYCLPSEITGWTDGYVKEDNGIKKIRYDDEALAHYESIRVRFPCYPFTYYFLAEAHSLRKSELWRQYAEEAVKRFSITTSLPDHSPDHSQALNDMKEKIKNA